MRPSLALTLALTLSLALRASLVRQVYFAVSVGAINLLLLFVTSLLGCFGCCGRVITGTLSTVRLVLELLALALFVAVAIAAQVELEGVKISQLTDTCDDFGIACAWGISIILMWSAVGLLAVGCVIHLASCCSCCCGGGKAGGEGDE